MAILTKEIKKKLITQANKEFNILLSIKDARPKLIGAGTLFKRIGDQKAKEAITSALSKKTDKYTKNTVVALKSIFTQNNS